MSKLIVFFLSVCLSSCTVAMWQGDYYTENVAGFYIEKNSQSLVALGEKYHYIFKIDKTLIDVLGFEAIEKITPSFYDFEITKNNKISGVLTLDVNEAALSNDAIQFFEKHGFKHGVSKISLYTKIRGTRYLIKESLSNIVSFDNAFEVNVKAPLNNGQIPKNILLTPVTIVGDAAIVTIALPVGVLMAVLMPFDI